MTQSTPIVETYQMTTASGRPIRKATRVTLDDVTIHFTEKMTKREAIKAFWREATSKPFFQRAANNDASDKR